MSKMSNVFIFFAGVAMGGAAAWFYAREKYAHLAEEEINSVKEIYAKREEQRANAATKNNSHEATSKVNDKPSITEYAKKVREEGYTDYSTPAPGKETPKAGDEPYVITPDEFGEIEEYTKISLVYFADGVLADDTNEPVDDVEEIVGDALNHFGEYEDDAVYVRNDAKRCDYEVLQDLRNYKDVLEDMPPRLD